MKIDVPDSMWRKFAEDVAGNMYCPLCDIHVYGGDTHQGHEEDCPLFKRGDPAPAPPKEGR